MTVKITIEKRFNGPSGSGNGGYSCGLLAQFIEGPARVRLRIPPPLDQPMNVQHKGAEVLLLCNGELVATGSPAKLVFDVPAPPDFESARRASSRYRGHESHYYPACFVCGPAREKGDGLRIFAGPVHSGPVQAGMGLPGMGLPGMVAATWIPDESLLDESARVSSEFLWAALDCPGAYAFPEPQDGAILLGELAVDIRDTVMAGENCVLLGWQTAHLGRKHFTTTALYGEDGRCCAIGQAIWIEVPVKPGD